MLKALLFLPALLFSLSSLARIREEVSDTIPKKDSLNKTVTIEEWIMNTDTADQKDQMFTKVEIEPSVDQKLWIRHLQNALPAYMDSAANKHIPAGTYKVQVRFIVERDGTVKDVRALNDPGYGLKEAATKVVMTGPKWRPGMQNGKIVRAYYTQPIVFVITED